MSVLTSNQVCNICCIHYNAGLRCCALGSVVEGGYLFNKGGSIAWIVSCFSREVTRTWYCRADAVTVAQAGNACGDWFVPSRADLQLGHDCKDFWDSYLYTYWTGTEYNPNCAWDMRLNQGMSCTRSRKSFELYVRAFRRVSY